MAPETTEGDQSIEELSKDTFLHKFGNLLYLFEYIRRPKFEINPICINYFTKLTTSLISNRPYDFYVFFHNEDSLLDQLYIQKEESDVIQSTINILARLAYEFASVSEMLGKMISEEGLTNKFKPIKEKVVEGILKQLLLEQNIMANC